MKNRIQLSSKTYHQLLLIVPAIALLAFADSPTANGAERQARKHSYVQIGASAYNPESKSFDRPWPFGPESTQQ